MKIEKYAAVDIGSNAVRLLISNVIISKGKNPQFVKYSLTRVPLRLGEEVFLTEEISEKSAEKLSKTMQAFKLLMEIHKVSHYRVCATSAFRESKNKYALSNYILKNTGIKIEIINGTEEAEIIAANHLNTFLKSNENYMYVDVGGGSTEFSIYKKGKKISSKSFRIGTLRLLNNIVKESMWEQTEQWVKENTRNIIPISLIGTGGNINKIFKSSNLKLGKPMSLDYLLNYQTLLEKYTYEERIEILRLNEDRSDVITYALSIYIKSMLWCGAKKTFVPKIGLSDGIIKSLFYKNQKNK